MKKLIAALCVALLLALTLASCQDPAAPPSSDSDGVSIRIGALTGPTAMGMVSLMDRNERGEAANAYDFTLAGSADELTPKLIRGDLDMAAIPANLAAVLYGRTEGALQVVAVNTLGVLYIVEANDAGTVQSMEDLAGRTIYATGKGSTPEYTLRYLLTSHGIDPDKDVTIDFKSEPNEVVSALTQNGGIAMLPQPYVTTAQGQTEGLRIALDLTLEWDAVSTDSSLITGVMVVNRAFAAQHPELLSRFLTEYEESIAYVGSNPSEAAQLMEEFHITKAAVAEAALPFCNLVFLSGSEMKDALSGYLEVLYEQNPQAVGASIPDEAFYYLP